MTVDIIKCLTLIWLFVVKTCVECNHVPRIFPGPLNVPAAYQGVLQQIPVACELCGKQEAVRPISIVGDPIYGVLSNDAVLQQQNQRPLYRHFFIGWPKIYTEPWLGTPDFLNLPIGINRELDMRLLASNEMLHPLNGFGDQNNYKTLLKGTVQGIPTKLDNIDLFKLPRIDPTVQITVKNNMSPRKLMPVEKIATFSLIKNEMTASGDRWVTITSDPHYISTEMVPRTTMNVATQHVTENTSFNPTKSDLFINNTNTAKTDKISENRRKIQSAPFVQNVVEPVTVQSREQDKEDTAVLYETLRQKLDQFERKFYLTTFLKLTSINPDARGENGISFVESGLFLYLILTAFSTTIDNVTKAEIEKQLFLTVSDTDRIKMIRLVLNMLPPLSEELKFRSSSRLLVNGSHHFDSDATKALRMHVDSFDPTEDPVKLTHNLNRWVEEDSGGTMRDTFEEEELAEGARAILLNTLYMRARWRASPTLLNDSQPFYDVDAPGRTTRMIRINDYMKHAYLPEWDAQAVEISYSTPGLSLMMLVPRGQSLRQLAEKSSAVSLQYVISKMQSRRVVATLPIYTLRMTLLLPNKLEAMNMSQLVNTKDSTDNTRLRLSHAVQRLMFWAEAGRNAFKDDGIEWDESPELEVMVDRPYLFFVRWRNLTLMNGNFVL